MRNKTNLIKDLVIILISIAIAVVLVQTKIIEKLITRTMEFKIIGNFIAGIFFTSIFTVAPATVALAEIAKANSVFLTAIFGGLGALLGDFIIFRFIKNNLSKDLIYLVRKTRNERFSSIFRLRLFRHLMTLAGAVVIASPLPDELGLAMMGLSKIKTSLFVPISFLLNSTGILIIGLIAKRIG